MQIGQIVINPGFIYAYYAICFGYVAYTFYRAGRKGNTLAVDMYSIIGLFTLALTTVSVGLLLFADRPYAMAFVTKILGFGAWYAALVASSSLFCKLVMPRVKPFWVSLFFVLFGSILLIYHYFNLEPVVINSTGVPYWNVAPLVNLLEGIVTATYYSMIGIAYGYQAARAGHTMNGLSFAAGCVLSALFMPLTYSIENESVYVMMAILCALAQTVLALSLLARVASVRAIRYFSGE